MTKQHNTALYTGVTNDLKRRAYEHRTGEGRAFTCRYSAVKLVCCEQTGDVLSAIECRKQIEAG